MVCDHALLAVKIFFYLSVCLPGTADASDSNVVSVAFKTAEIFYGKLGEMTIYDHVQPHIATLI